MAYSPDYTESDLGPAVIDGIVKLAVFVGAFAAVIGLVILWNFVRGKGFSLR